MRSYQLSSLIEKAYTCVGEYKALTSHLEELKAKLEECVREESILSAASTLLTDFATFRFSQLIEALESGVSSCVSQVFGDRYTVTLDPKLDTRRGVRSLTILVGDGKYVGSVDTDSGQSMRNLVSFGLWLRLFSLVRKSRPNVSPVLFWDEPFVNVHPDRMDIVAPLLEACANLGFQVFVCTNHSQMVPALATVVELA